MAIFRGPISGRPEVGLGGPNLDRVQLEIQAVGCGIYTTYRYVTLSIPAGTLKAALTAMLRTRMINSFRPPKAAAPLATASTRVT